jgi:hypothetical protein
MMKKLLLVFGLAMFFGVIAYSQDQASNSKKIAEGNTNTPFGKYTIEVQDEPVMLEGEQVTSYKITYENSPVSVVVLVDKEKKCKNYIVVSEGLSIMYTCNGSYFGVNLIDPKYGKEGYVTDGTKINLSNYYRQKVMIQGKQEEVAATTLIASYFPMLIK